ncbi:response regulator transcription factor [Blastococcus sp. Marseille-P5729]|uniref:response regulator n=1 Tax=Blastococcus sp. Marseille-P5729 TaxID=2086582 RepID=UPI000D11146C|nr:response regulator transcription factor [Blastococcus sp. Marseille-P5729]
MIRLLIVDDDPMVCGYLSTILEDAEDIEVIGVSHDGAAAVDDAVRFRPDVILMDIRMPGVNGVVATRRISGLNLPSKVVALTSFESDDAVLGAMDAGATGFLLKSTAPSDLIALVRAASSGHSVLAPEATRRLTAGRAGADPGMRQALGTLTRREREVLVLIGEGSSNSAIAARLGLSEGTVKGYVSRVLDKLGCQNRTQAGLIAHAYLRR